MKDKNTLTGLLEESTEKFGDRLALASIDKETFTYSQLNELKLKISFWLSEQGLKKGDKVAILAENSPNWVSIFLGAVTTGIVTVPILPDFSSNEVNSILEHSDSRILFISKRILNRHGERLLFERKHVVITDDLTLLEDGSSLIEYAEKSSYNSFTPESVEPEDVANIIYTSGTTGRSKGVMLTHENLTYEAEKVLLVQDVNETDVFLSLLPLSHVYENVLGMILPLKQGASVYYMHKLPTPSVLIGAMNKVHPTMILMVPLIIEKIYATRILPELTKNRILRGAMHVWPIRHLLHNKAGKRLKKAFGGRIRFLGVGGAPLNPKTERFLRDAGFPYSCGYGLTETSSLIFASKVGKVKFGSVGKPLNGLEYRIIRPTAKSKEGEVVVKWKGNMKGYYKEPGITESVLTAGNWFHTGDLAEMENGNMYIRGRSKTMILGPSGENIYPEEIESVLNRMEGVIESLVYEAKGKIVAKVYLNTEELSKKYAVFKEAASYHSGEVHHKLSNYLTDMRKKLNDHLGKYSQVYKLELVSHPFEKTPTHKIKRHLYKG